MSEKCVHCGSKMGGILGSDRLSKWDYERLDAIGITEKDICVACAARTLMEEQQRIKSLIKSNQEEVALFFSRIKIFTAPAPELWKAEIKGIVSGYSVIGTGPLTAMASAWTDFFGKESVAYLEKIRIGENNAMLAARMQAAELGASAISSCTVTVTEATSGNGMLMVSCVGTAISLGSDDELSSKLIALQAEITALREQLKKIE